MPQPEMKIYSDGTKSWYLNGKLHRIDGPAVEFQDGSKEWWINGKFHRTDGPAVEYSGGSKEWYLNGKRHREDGPACEYSGGSKYWFLNGKQLTEQEFLAQRPREQICPKCKSEAHICLKGYVICKGNCKPFYLSTIRPVA